MKLLFIDGGLTCTNNTSKFTCPTHIAQHLHFCTGAAGARGLCQAIHSNFNPWAHIGQLDLPLALALSWCKAGRNCCIPFPPHPHWPGGIYSIYCTQILTACDLHSSAKTTIAPPVAQWAPKPTNLLAGVYSRPGRGVMSVQSPAEAKGGGGALHRPHPTLSTTTCPSAEFTTL